MLPDDAPPTPRADAQGTDEPTTAPPPTTEVESTHFTSPPVDPEATHDEIPPALDSNKSRYRKTLTAAEFLDALLALPLLDAAQRSQVLAMRQRYADIKAFGQELIRQGLLTSFQANQIAGGLGSDLVLDQYILIDLLGQGGMGAVFKARQQRMDRFVAVKLIRREALNSPGAVERFQREAKAAAKLSHPNVVTVHDTNRINGVHFLVMEYIEGSDLAKVVMEKGPLPVGFACDCIHQAALGLQHAHEQGLIHRDIKPHNLMLTKQRIVKVMDMGLARTRAVADAESDGLTATGAVMGTADYIAPEQALNAKGVDIRADIYSLGCSLYHLLTGRPPFVGGSLTEKLMKHQVEEPESVEQLRPELPNDLPPVVRKMMAKKTEHRYQTPAAVAQAIETFRQTSGDGGVWPIPASRDGVPTGPLPPTISVQAGASVCETLTEPSQDVQETNLTSLKSRPRVGRRMKLVLLVGGIAAILLAVAVSLTLTGKYDDLRTDREGLERAFKTTGSSASYVREAAPKRAERWRVAAEAGQPLGQYLWGQCLQEGCETAQSDTEAVKWYKKAADQSSAMGQSNLGFMYQQGWGVAKDDAEAVKWFKKAADQGFAQGQVYLGWMYLNGRGVAKDEAEALNLYRKATEQGYANGQVGLGFIYEKGLGVAKDEVEAVMWYRKAAEQNFSIAQFNLGALYEKGLGVAKDDAEAVKWYKKAADQGCVSAQNNLGFMYENGRGVAKDETEAFEWFRKAAASYRKAAERGDAQAQINLGWFYASGTGVSKDEAEAVKWYKKAAEQGDSQAQNNLGIVFQNGQGVAKDEAEAVKWYKKAAEQGHAWAQNNLGFMYENGRGWRRTKPRPLSGIGRPPLRIGRPPNRVIPRPRTAWASCSRMDRGWRRTKLRPSNGIKKPPNRVMPGPRTTWASCTRTVREWPGIKPRPLSGIARLLHKEYKTLRTL